MVAEGDVGRVFLQSIISRRVVSDKLIRVLFKKSIEAVKAIDENVKIRDNSFEQQIHQLNNSLEPLDFKIASILDETTGVKIWAFINTKSDELSQIATDFTPVEIAYFRNVVEQIILASHGSYSVSSMTALREVNNLKQTITKSHAQNLLDTFVVKGWLLKSRRGRYSLSSRTLLELQTYLKANYEDDIHECTICLELLTKGIGCYTRQCGARLHAHCYKRFARESKVQCPSCKADWSDKKQLQMIGEDAIRDGQDSVAVTKRTRENYIDDDSEELAEDEETSEESEPQAESGSKGKAKSKAKLPVSDDEDADTTEDSLPKKTSRRRK